MPENNCIYEAVNLAIDNYLAALAQWERKYPEGAGVETFYRCADAMIRWTLAHPVAAEALATLIEAHADAVANILLGIPHVEDGER